MKKIILHCSASNYGNAALFDNWHRARGFKKGEIHIGYHFVILNGQLTYIKHKDDMLIYDGLVETGRYMEVNGAHTKGHNKGIIEVCLVGQSGKFTKLQKESLLHLLQRLRIHFGSLKICQHSDFSKQKPFCAGFTEEEIKDLNNIINKKVTTEWIYKPAMS